MRERAPALLYIAAAIALCGVSIAGVRSVRSSEDVRMRAAERAAQEAIEDSQRALRELESIMRELEALDAAIKRALETLEVSSNDVDRSRRADELRRLQENYQTLRRRAVERKGRRSPCRIGVGATWLRDPSSTLMDL